VSLTPDWTLWPWPDGAQLCARCNEARHAREDWTEIERREAAAEAKRRQ
jgi:hypothetical protein